MTHVSARRLLLTGSAVTLVAVIGWALAGLQPGSASDADLPAAQYGMGGPAEKPLAEMLSAGTIELDRVAGLGAFVQAPECNLLPNGQLGPVFRRDEGPVEMRIGRGQTFYEALAARDVAHEDIMTLVKACKGFRDLRKVKTGELFRVHVTSDGGLQSLGFDLDEESHVVWVREGDSYTRQDFTYPVENRLVAVGGTIEVSLYASLQKLDAPLDLA